MIQEYDQVVFVENEVNLGGGLSRNNGISHASGEFIAFLDDDDEYIPEKIEKQYNLYLQLNNPNIAMIYCYAKMVNVDGSSYTYKNDVEGNNIVEHVKHCVAPTSFWFCPKQRLIEVGGFEDISSRQDASLLLKMLMRGYEVYRVPEILLVYYWHDAAHGITKNNMKTARAEIQYKKLYESLCQNVGSEENAKVEYYFAYRLALIYILNSERKAAFGELKNMVQYKVISTEVLRVFLGCVFNRFYQKLSAVKNSKRVGS